MEITEDRTILYKAGSYCVQQPGIYRAELSQQEVTDLNDLLNAMRFSELKEEYAINVSDNPSAHLSIEYDGGRVKKIEDYGKSGTVGLRQVYRIMDIWRKEKDWQRVRWGE